MKGFIHLIVPKENFELLKGGSELEEYRFNTKVAKHLFCRHCGVESFYVPRSHPDDYSVNLRCIEAVDFSQVELIPFDGANGEAAVKKTFKN